MSVSCLCSFGGDSPPLFFIFCLSFFHHHSTKNDLEVNSILTGLVPQKEL